MVLKHSCVIEALRAEVLRLRRWRFGRSAEVINTNIAPELPLTGGESAPAQARGEDFPEPRPPKLMAVEAITSKARPRRPARLLPPELPRVLKVHSPGRCTCPECGQQLSRLGEDTSEQLDYVHGYFQVIRHVSPKLTCQACATIVQAPVRLCDRASSDTPQRADQFDRKVDHRAHKPIADRCACDLCRVRAPGPVCHSHGVSVHASRTVEAR
jgi:hypothetical protein